MGQPKTRQTTKEVERTYIQDYQVVEIRLFDIGFKFRKRWHPMGVPFV